MAVLFASSSLAPIPIEYPAPGAMFPPEVTVPTCLWHDGWGLWCLRLFLVAFAIAVSLGPASAQVTAAISGKVEDPSGAGVSGATVTVKSLETGATRVVTTDEAGNFRALSLPLGPQEVKAEKHGFKARSAPGSISRSARKRS